MAAEKKILINNAQTRLSMRFGETLRAGATLDVSHIPTRAIGRDASLIAKVLAGEIDVSDGRNVLTAEAAQRYLLDQVDGLVLVSQNSSSARSSTTSQNRQVKLVATVNVELAGSYRLGWYFDYSYSDTSANFNASLIHRKPGQTQAEVVSLSSRVPNVNTILTSTGFKYMDLAAGVHEFDLGWWCGNKSDVAYIQDASIELWKVESLNASL